jgi:hypothetical protein
MFFDNQTRVAKRFATGKSGRRTFSRCRLATFQRGFARDQAVVFCRPLACREGAKKGAKTASLQSVPFLTSIRDFSL